MDKKIENDFKRILSELRELEKIYNPQGENLHFFSLEKVDDKLYPHLLGLAREGLATVQRHRDYFLSHSLYDDGMFWYQLFVMISAAALKVKTDKKQQEVPSNIVKELIELLVDMVEFSFPGGDIVKRNHEALGNTLYCFYSSDLVNLVRERGQGDGDHKIIDFVERTISRVEEVMKENLSNENIEK
ncbi:MAG: hypothetical protein MUP98_18345 [Candidatus Aminicenantes bacterium]|nr:hypothetical protein [Candidatus Aminicenantes bacterium]